ncbi:MAG: TetR family transcriptional regulator, partial [Sciscionella sp.]|nr:TetR family transcriptional regulator [Sciscionella sp.]
MGNREDLLAGAKKCLLDKGYARTTARDIAAAAGTSLAAIGYHFRTKDALLNEAVLDLTGTEFGNAFEKALRSTNATDGLAGFEAVWDQLIDALRQHRAVLAVSAETLGQIEHVPEIRAAYRAAQPHA